MFLSDLRGWKAVVVGVIIVGGICFRVFNSTKQYRGVESGTWNVPAEQAWLYEFKTARDIKVRIELSRAEPRPLLVYLVDATNHRKLQAKEPDAPPPADLAMLFKSEGTPTVIIDGLSLSTGSYFLYVENIETAPIAVKFNISEAR